MRAQNQAYLAAAGYSNTGYSNTGAPILPNLGRTTRISFPTEDESSIGRRTMKRGIGSRLLPGVLAYLTDSDLPMLVDKTSKKRSGRGAAAAVKDDEVADAKLATAAGMSHGKAFDKIIEKEAIAAAGESSKTNAAEDAGEDLGEGAASVSEEGGAASVSEEEAAPPAAAVGGGLWYKKKQSADKEGGEADDRKLYKSQIASVNAHKKAQKVALVDADV
jgi:hypothetical protein